MDQTTVKEIVIADFRTAAIFERNGIDFCCGGSVPLDQACADRGLDAGLLREELRQLSASGPSTDIRYEEWELDALADHIVRAHHSYVREALPPLLLHTAKVAKVHGERHPEVVEIAGIFQDVAAELSSHMQKEELMLFPAVRALAQSRREGRPAPPIPFGSIANPIRVMEMEHASAGGGLERIRQISRGFQPPDDACTTYRVSYQELQHFERDLHIHIHLENNILFPAAIALESQLAMVPQ
jgi:regulator of cell morphogenesis and NO signaling